MLAANIGAGATVGAAGLAYRDGLSAWWWSGSAGLGSLVFAFWVGAAAVAAGEGARLLHDRRLPRVPLRPVRARVAATLLVGLGTLALLAGQLIAGAAILNVITGVPRWAGALVGGAIMTVYFTAGGLLGTAWVNILQLVVMLAGFVAALPFALGASGGLGALTAGGARRGSATSLYSAGPGSGWTLLALTGPAFVISPGLIQKAYGARERARADGPASR